MKVNCTECDNNFKNVWNLKRHVSRKHPDKISQLVPQTYKNKSNYKWSCDVCGKNFNSKYHIKYHKRTHGSAPSAQNNLNSYKCPLCYYKHSSKKLLIIHFQETHNIEIVSESSEFDTRNDFNLWKRQLEDESNCKFVKVFSKVVANKIYTHFVCHRSGKFVSKGKGIRRLRTTKINAFCPATLKLFEEINKKCTVSYILQHIGHKNLLDEAEGNQPPSHLHMVLDGNIKIEEEVVLEEISASNNINTELSFSDKKSDVKQKLLGIMNILDNIETADELQKFENIINAICSHFGDN